MKKIIIIILAVAVIVGAYVLLNADDSPVPPSPLNGQDRVMDIETYVRLNISELSPEPEVLGGKFYVTEIVTGDGKGVVSYEDGHVAFIADFTYKIDDEKGIVIEKFSIRK